MDKIAKQTTIDTYNNSAKQLAEYFKGIGPRMKYIEEAFSYQDNSHPRVLEIGCGDGRDASAILSLTDDYTGIDISVEAIKIAQKKNPNGTFVVGDIEDSKLQLPSNVDVVISFASVLHTPKDELRLFFARIAKVLNSGGVMYISTKARDAYEAEVKEDRFGSRLFYYYTPELLIELAGDSFEVVKNEFEEKLGNIWIEMALRKKHD